jgi:cobalt-zinc-cadmium efflux system membrane fusion protein
MAASVACSAPSGASPRSREAAQPQEKAGAEGSASDFCPDHHLPQAVCTACNPALAPVFKAAGDWCTEHNFPESMCPLCHPREGEVTPMMPLASNDLPTVRLNPPELEVAAGIATLRARELEESVQVECAATLSFDPDRTAQVRALVPSLVRKVRVQIGQEVAKSTPLFELESNQVGAVHGELRSMTERIRGAKANLDRQLELRSHQIAAARHVELAQQELATAQAQYEAASATLKLAGSTTSSPSGKLVLSAPISGTIVTQSAIVGHLAREDVVLATIADTSRIWARCEVPQSAMDQIALGQNMTVIADGREEVRLRGAITWIAADVDPRTRTIGVRAEMDNPNGRLRANQMARAIIDVAKPRATLAIPRQALVRLDQRTIVFVRRRAGVFQPREVVPLSDGEFIHVQGNLRAGEEVVTVGTVLLKTEMMPGSIGAGCCEGDHAGGD